MHFQDLITLDAKRFIQELDGKEFTEKHFRSIVFGNSSNLAKTIAKEQILRDFVRHPSVQLNGVGMNGNIMDKFIKQAESEKEMWKNLLIRDINK